MATRDGAGAAGTVEVVRRTAVLPLALAAWTLFIWGTRIRNIARDGGGALSLVLAVGMVALGVAAAVAVWRDGRPAWAVPALAVATVATWLVRTPLILVADHGAGFKVVHTALAVVSFALAVATWRQAERRTSPALAR